MFRQLPFLIMFVAMFGYCRRVEASTSAPFFPSLDIDGGPASLSPEAIKLLNRRLEEVSKHSITSGARRHLAQDHINQAVVAQDKRTFEQIEHELLEAYMSDDVFQAQEAGGGEQAKDSKGYTERRARYTQLIRSAIAPHLLSSLGEHAVASKGYISAKLHQKKYPGLLSNTLVGVHERVVNPVMSWYYANKDAIDLITKMTVIASGIAYIFNKFGGTEWVRNKIREAFDKPTIYEVRRRKTGWFGKKPQALLSHSDLILAPETRKQVNELIFLVNRRYEVTKATKVPLALPRVLLWGPPGTAKTSIAQLIADHTIGDNGKPMEFIRLMASDFMQVKSEGDRIAVLKEMFEKAARKGNTIIFLDEIDGMCGQRGKDAESPNRGFLDHLLDEIAQPSTRFMVIAATNHISRMDNALLSRFTRQISVGLPPPHQRKMILDLYADRVLLSKGYRLDVDTATIANIMKGSPGRELQAFIDRLKERLDFLSLNVATQEIVNEILVEMGKLPPPIDKGFSDFDDGSPLGGPTTVAAP